MAKPITAEIRPNDAPINVYIPLRNGNLTAEMQQVVISGNGGGNILVDTTEGWNAKTTLIAEKNVVYMYSDHETNSEGQPVPGFKLGDGLAYLIDLPFNDDLMVEHIQDTSSHVTPEEKEFWNNKVTAYINAENLEELVLSKI